MVASSSPVGAVLDIVTQLSAIVGKFLKGVEDKPLGTIINSYTVLNGDFDKLGIKEFKYDTKKVDFELDLIVRDKERVKEAGPADVRLTKLA